MATSPPPLTRHRQHGSGELMTLQVTPQRRCQPTNPFFFTAKQPEDLGSHLTPSGATVTRPLDKPLADDDKTDNPDDESDRHGTS